VKEEVSPEYQARAIGRKKGRTMAACVRDLWCRCPRCFKKNYRYEAGSGIEPPDPLYGRRDWKEPHGSGKPVAVHDYAVGTIWNAERELDFRCFGCGWQCPAVDGGLVRRRGVPQDGIYYPAGVRIGLCQRCRWARRFDIRAILWQFGELAVPMSREMFLKAGKGRKTERHRMMLSYAVTIAELAGATRSELAEVTGLDKATISRLIRQPTAPRPLVEVLFKLCRAFGLGQVGERRGPPPA
jgi:Helix-turn-helix